MNDPSQASAPLLAVSIQGGCTAIGVRPTKMRELINSGEITAVKIGRKTVIKVDSLRAFIDRQPSFKAA